MTSQEILDKYVPLISEKVKRDFEIQFLRHKTGHYEEVKDFSYVKYQEEDSSLGRYRIVEVPQSNPYRSPIASWKLEEFPACCGIAISCNSYIAPSHRGKGLGVVLNNLRQDICRVLGFSCLICTDVSTNTPQRKILQKNGWRDIHEFKNSRTNHQVLISAINL